MELKYAPNNRICSRFMDSPTVSEETKLPMVGQN